MFGERRSLHHLRPPTKCDRRGGWEDCTFDNREQGRFRRWHRFGCLQVEEPDAKFRGDAANSYSSAISSISYSRRPFGVSTTAESPSLLPIIALASGDMTEILLSFTFASSSPTIL